MSSTISAPGRPEGDLSGPLVPRVAGRNPGAPNVLFVGYYFEDTRTLIRVAGRAREELGIRPRFLITSDEPLHGPAREAVLGAGYDLIEGLPLQDTSAARGVYNPYRKVRLLREANARVSRHILDHAEADAVVATVDVAGGYFLETATARGIPSVLMQWTEYHSKEVHEAWWRQEDRAKDAALPPLRRLKQRARRALDHRAGHGPRWVLLSPATFVAVAGPFYREMCLRGGVPEARIRVTGNTQCDDIALCSRLGREDLLATRAAVGLGPDEPFILYAREHVARFSHLDPRSAAEAERDTLRGLREAAPGVARVVKVHPKEGAEDRARLSALDPEAVVIGGEVEIGPLIAASSLVVSGVSSALLWAVGLDRPAISAFLWKGVDEARMRRHWAGVEMADTPEELVAAVRGQLFDAAHAAHWHGRRLACRDDFLRLDGRSVERVVGLIGEALSVRGTASGRPNS